MELSMSDYFNYRPQIGIGQKYRIDTGIFSAENY
jgi:hypothetical protein